MSLSGINPFSKVTAVKVSGALHHPDKRPLNDQKISLCSQGLFEEKLATATTDKDGNYVFNCNLNTWKHEETVNAVIKVKYEALKGEGGGVRTVDRIPVEIRLQKEVDLGTHTAKLFESKDNIPTLDMPKELSKRPELPSKKFLGKLFKVAPKDVAKQLLADFAKLSTENVHKLYPPAHPEMQLTEETTLDLIRNGIYPCQFIKMEDSDELINTIKWPYDKDGSADIFDMSITVTNGKDGFKIKEIAVKTSEGDKTYIPSDKDFKDALYLFNCMALVKGEGVNHLALGHLMFGQLARGFCQHIRNHPIFNLLGPIFPGVANIDDLGASLIFGPTGVINLSGLSDKGVEDLIKDTLSAFCYSSFIPRASMNSKDTFADAQRLFWDICGQTVDKFFEENMKEIASKDHWHEIFYMSEALVENSLPFKEFEGGPPEGYVWADKNEIDSSKEGRRPTKDGKGVHTLRPITESKDGPAEGDIANLKRLCQYALFLPFYHQTMHQSQKKWATNLHIASLAPQKGGKGSNYGNTKPADAAHQLTVADVLISFDADKLIDNPNKNVYIYFIELLLKYEAEFAKLGFNVREFLLGVTI